jgi:hypothetical protein
MAIFPTIKPSAIDKVCVALEASTEKTNQTGVMKKCSRVHVRMGTVPFAMK